MGGRVLPRSYRSEMIKKLGKVSECYDLFLFPLFAFLKVSESALQ